MSYLLAYNPYNTNLFMKNRSIDPAAQAYFNATGITGDAQQQAINNLVKSLKQSGLWSKMKAVYPFVTDNRNLLSYTEDFGNAYWNLGTPAIKTPNYATAPDGTMTACRVYNGGYIQSQGISKQIGTYVFSLYVKMTSGTSGTIRLFVDGGATKTIVNVTNTWTRVEVNQTFALTDTSTIGFFVDSDVLIWHPQVELGSTATTYQPIATTQQAFISSQFKYNLKDPRDTDAAFRLVFNGGWSFSSTGATSNGVNGYADTYLVPSSVLAQNSTHLSFYSRTNRITTGVYETPMGSQDSTTYFRTRIYQGNTPKSWILANSLATWTQTDNVTNTQGFFIGSRENANKLTWGKNGVVLATNTTTETSQLPNAKTFISALSQNNSATEYAQYETAFATIGDGLTDNDATNLYYYTQVFQTTLGRQVGSPAYALPTVSDINAKLYLSAIGSTTDSTLNNAVDTFIKGLKADGIYSKMKAVYPFATDNRNLLSYTEDFGNAFWYKNAVTISTNTVTAPNGTLTADSIVENTVNTEHYVGVLSGLTLTAVPYTLSVYLKKAGRDWFSLGLYNGTDSKYAWFNLNTGTIGTINSGVTANIESVGNGWYRCSVTRTMASNSNNFIGIHPTISDGGGAYLGNGSVSTYLWGAQLELGSTATTYQPILTTQQAYISSQFKYNMVNPQDDDSAFRLVFNGGWTHSANGALPNGTNGYADTKLVPSSVFSNANNSGASIYQTNPPTAFSHGCFDSNSRMFAQLNMTEFDARMNTTAAVVYKIPYVNNGIGMVTTSRNTSDNVRAFKNGSFINQVTVDSQLVGVSSFVGARNANGIASEYDNTIQKFLAYHNGLTDTEAANLYTRVQTFNQALSRQVGVPIVSDADAQAFLNSAEITDITQANAINNLVIGLKADSLWTKMKAIYPFVGGTASTHKYNLKDPRDLDAAYRLVFNGGWTHSAQGVTPNGTNGYANTYFNPNTQLTNTNFSISVYRNNATNSSGTDIGAYGGGEAYYYLGGAGTLESAIAFDGFTNIYTEADRRGLFTVNALSGTTVGYKNGVSKISYTTVGNIPSSNSFLGANNYNGGIEFSNARYAFAAYNNALTPIEAANLYTQVQAFQTALNRQV